MADRPVLPEALAPFAGEIAASVKPIIAVEVLDEAPPTGSLSRLGGRPWWPEGRPFPKDADGRDMYLLIQLDFSDMTDVPPFPSTGLLQIFVHDSEERIWGADLNDPRSRAGFDCVYHGDLAVPATRERHLPPSRKAFVSLPLEDGTRPLGLRFNRSSMPADYSDYRFARLLPLLNAAIETDYDLLDTYFLWAFANVQAWLGGYSAFVQTDPRAYRPELGDFNLLTIDTGTGIMWGDAGIGQFMMREEDLIARDFSSVAYSWDNH